MTYNWTDEDIRIVEKFIEIKNKGYYCSGEQVTEVHNRVLGTNLRPTNCGSCIRQRVQALEDALNKFKSLQEKAVERVSEPEVNDVKAEDEKPVKTKRKGK